jgi:hypothetical protein
MGSLALYLSLLIIYPQKDDEAIGWKRFRFQPENRNMGVKKKWRPLRGDASDPWKSLKREKYTPSGYSPEG